MGPLPIFKLVFAPQVVGQVLAFKAEDRRLIQETIHRELRSLPVFATRRRQPLLPLAPFGATWELRFGPGNRFRVYYEVDREAKIVTILAVGVREKNRLIVAGKEYKV